jgi:hypothetical protein
MKMEPNDNCQQVGHLGVEVISPAIYNGIDLANVSWFLSMLKCFFA